MSGFMHLATAVGGGFLAVESLSVWLHKCLQGKRLDPFTVLLLY